mmetsp:Transcript_39027/g.52936  ORF Transcript_39027/g.52936 Transcript_39027/m.52936 type:complete len:91 (+) Transcript_39027:1063-1335(+)
MGFLTSNSISNSTSVAALCGELSLKVHRESILLNTDESMTLALISVGWVNVTLEVYAIVIDLNPISSSASKQVSEFSCKICELAQKGKNS